MMTPHELFNAVVKSTGDRVAAIRAIRERFGLELSQAKEVMLQAEGVAASLDEHEERIADDLSQEMEEGALPMPPGNENCPFDRSPLACQSGFYAWDGLDLSIGYCPRCDVAFGFLALTDTKLPLTVFQWHRREERLELRVEDRSRWEVLPRRLRESWSSTIPHLFEHFLSTRHSEKFACPRDGCPVPTLHRWHETSGTSWLLTWCRWCRMGFLFASDPDYGWEPSGAVVWHSNHQSYELVEKYATGAGHEVRIAMLSELPPFPQLTPNE